MKLLFSIVLMLCMTTTAFAADGGLVTQESIDLAYFRRDCRLERLAANGAICEKFGHNWKRGWSHDKAPAESYDTRECRVCGKRQALITDWIDKSIDEESTP